MQNRFDESRLTRLQRMPRAHDLMRLAIQLKCKPTDVPHKNSHSRRWRVLTNRGDLEMSTTGSKGLDARERGGGSCAIDLAIPLLGVLLLEAVTALGSRGLPRNREPSALLAVAAPPRFVMNDNEAGAHRVCARAGWRRALRENSSPAPSLGCKR